jgi:hypothetical protein
VFLTVNGVNVRSDSTAQSHPEDFAVRVDCLE